MDINSGFDYTFRQCYVSRRKIKRYLLKLKLDYIKWYQTPCYFIYYLFILDDEQTIPEYTVRRRTSLSRTDSMDVPSPRNSYNGDIAHYTPVHVNIIITMLIFTGEV